MYIEKKKQEKQRVEWIWNSLKEIEQPTAPSSIPAQIVKRGTDWAAMVYVLLDTLGKVCRPLFSQQICQNASSLAQIAACALREEQYNLANQLLKSLEAILDGQPLQSGEDLIVTFSESCRGLSSCPSSLLCMPRVLSVFFRCGHSTSCAAGNYPPKATRPCAATRD